MRPGTGRSLLARQPAGGLAVGRVALALGRTAVAEGHLVAVAAGRRRGPALSRAAAWLAEALRAKRLATRAVSCGLPAGAGRLDEYRDMLGSSELRAQSTAHGAELANLGQRHALRLGRPSLMLAWSERWRAVTLAVPRVRPPADEQLQADLAALRESSSRLSRAHSLALPTTCSSHEQQRLERAVRARALRTLGTSRRHLAQQSASLQRFRPAG